MWRWVISDPDTALSMVGIKITARSLLKSCKLSKISD